MIFTGDKKDAAPIFWIIHFAKSIEVTLYNT